MDKFHSTNQQAIERHVLVGAYTFSQGMVLAPMTLSAGRLRQDPA
jgi:hypothetical protein